MSSQNNSDARDILNCLKSVNQAFRDNDFSSLEAFIEIMNDFTTASVSLRPEQAKKMLTIADENQVLIASSIRGIRSAKERLKEITAATHGFTGYDDHGQSQSISQNATMFEYRF